MTVRDDDEDYEKREFAGSERKEIRGIIWHFRFRKRIRDAIKVWISTAGIIAAGAVALSTLYSNWIH